MKRHTFGTQQRITSVSSHTPPVLGVEVLVRRDTLTNCCDNYYCRHDENYTRSVVLCIAFCLKRHEDISAWVTRTYLLTCQSPGVVRFIHGEGSHGSAFLGCLNLVLRGADKVGHGAVANRVVWRKEEKKLVGCHSLASSLLYTRVDFRLKMSH